MKFNYTTSKKERIIVYKLNVTIVQVAMAKHKYAYFDDVFNQFVSGFRYKHICKTVLTLTIADNKQSLDESNTVFVLLMDLSKSFDGISRNFYSQMSCLGTEF